MENGDRIKFFGKEKHSRMFDGILKDGKCYLEVKYGNRTDVIPLKEVVDQANQYFGPNRTGIR